MSKRERYTLVAGAFLFLAATVFAAFGTAEAAGDWRYLRTSGLGWPKG